MQMSRRGVRNVGKRLRQTLDGKGDGRATGRGCALLHETLLRMVVGSATVIIHRSVFLGHPPEHVSPKKLSKNCFDRQGFSRVQTLDDIAATAAVE
jgi:hypothetical protein